MPRITNPEYQKFFNSWVKFKPFSMDKFTKKLNAIAYPSAAKTAQARVLAILLYYTGLRPEEIISLKPEQFDKRTKHKQQKTYIYIGLKALKGGEEGELPYISCPHMEEAFEYAKKHVPGAFIFNYFRTKQLNKVTWTATINGETITKSKIYERHAWPVNYFCNKWFGVPPYHLRHNRFTEIIKQGGTLEKARLMKLGKTESSTRIYIKFDVHDREEAAEYIPHPIKENPHASTEKQPSPEQNQK